MKILCLENDTKKQSEFKAAAIGHAVRFAATLAELMELIPWCDAVFVNEPWPEVDADPVEEACTRNGKFYLIAPLNLKLLDHM